MKHTRTPVHLITSIALLALSAGAFAAGVSDEERVKHESAGTLGGAVIGGLLGGPVGAIATAAFGNWVGNLTVAEKENTALTQALEEKDREFLALQAEYRALEARYQVAAKDADSAKVRNVSFEAQPFEQTGQESITACCRDSELSLHFKTNSTVVESLYDKKLAEFADYVNAMPEAVISITGHADRRGDSNANLDLSQQRVQAVKEKLHSLGVNAFMQSSAFGESMPQSDTDSLENNFFDRRVVLKVISAGNGLLTRATD